MIKMKKQNQPFLKKPRQKRIKHSIMLASSVSDGLKMIASDESCSVSLIIAEIICEFFGIDYRTGRQLHRENVIDFVRRRRA